VVRTVGKHGGIVAGVEDDHQAAVGVADVAEQRVEIEDLLARIDLAPVAQRSRGVVDVEAQRGEMPARRGVALVDELDEVIVTRLVEGHGHQGAEAI
jgi:hypothetical protein